MTPDLRLADDTVFFFTSAVPADAIRSVTLPSQTDETSKFGEMLPSSYVL